MEKKVVIRQVWSENFEAEFSLIEKAIPFHPFLSFDTEFPGIVIQSYCPISSAPPQHLYDLMRFNVEALKIIQLGITLSDSHGNLPDFGTDSSYIWQFNFRDFKIERDFQNPDSIDMLEKQGIDFSKNREKGVDSRDFAARWLSSSVMERYRYSMTWITFHGGYDIGFLVKILTGQQLPGRLDWFMRAVEFYFGFQVYDLKFMSYNHGIHGGLEKIASNLGVCRLTGNKHEAASDSLLTVETFIKFMGIVYVNGSSFEFINGCRGKLYGLCGKTMLRLPCASVYEPVFFPPVRLVRVGGMP